MIGGVARTLSRNHSVESRSCAAFWAMVSAARDCPQGSLPLVSSHGMLMNYIIGPMYCGWCFGRA